MTGWGCEVDTILPISQQMNLDAYFKIGFRNKEFAIAIMINKSILKPKYIFLEIKVRENIVVYLNVRIF